MDRAAANHDNHWPSRLGVGVRRLTRRTGRALVSALTAGGCLVGLCGCTHVFQPGYASRATRLLEISNDLEGLGDGPGLGQLFPKSLTDATSGWTMPDDPAGGATTQPATGGPTTNPTTNPTTSPTTLPNPPAGEVVLP